MDNSSKSSTPSSFKSRFSRRFVRALMKIKSERRSSPTPPSTQVKIAADKSMALAVGSRRAWSRALLWKIHHHLYKAKRHRTRRRRVLVVVPSMRRRRRRRRISHHKRSRRTSSVKKMRDEDEDEHGHADELRKLVPGGEAMDLCRLLDETAHYLKCLVTQVQVMTTLDHHFNSTAN